MNHLFAIIIIISLLPLSVINAETSLNSELTRCAVIKRDLQRLACYDSLSGMAVTSPEEALSKKSKESIANKSNDNIALGHSQNSSAASIQSTQGTNKFGLEKKSGEIESITSYIPGEFKGWKNGDKLTLANGQVWKIKDSNGSFYHLATNPKVTISKGMFSSFRINIEGANKSARVQRVK
ncbi:MAG: hypothetical protein GY808_03575 [Gammaproteobacteria bacterium]|nr:hypothetical protein [Gammaproteobacteria bacterium]